MRFKPFVFLFVFAMALLACEKDDICIAGDTPKMRLAFFNADTTDLAKAPTNLMILGKGQSTALPLVSPSDATGFELLIPLNPSESYTEFYFVENASIDDEGNLSGSIELVRFSYNPTPVFISKACGFIPNYTELNSSLSQSNSHWIRAISIVKDSITHSNDIHVKIYH